MTSLEAKQAFKKKYPDKKIADVFSHFDGKFYTSYDLTNGVQGISWLDNMAQGLFIDEKTGVIEEISFGEYVDMLLAKGIKEQTW